MEQETRSTQHETNTFPIQKEEKNKPSSGYFVSFLIFSVLVSSFFGGIFGYLAGSLSDANWESLRKGNWPTKKTESSAPSAQVREKIIQEDSAITEVVEKSSPAVVSIIITKDIPQMRQFYFGPFFFPGQEDESGEIQKERISSGTGFFITEDGLIVTNKHVVSDSNAAYTVITTDGKEYEAMVLARDPVNDIAILKVNGNGYPTLDFGDSESLKIGQTAIAIGNSLGEFSNTVSKGIISGLKRKVTAGSGYGDTESLNDIIQTDAAINPGNSGGPLLNIDGVVIGVNVAIAQGAQNIGFAIPASQVKKVAEQVRKTGKISTPYLGVRYLPVDETLQKEIKLDYAYGALIVRGNSPTDFAVVPGSPADKAGLVENDIILEINGAKIDEENSLAQLIAKFNTGDEIKLKVWHKGTIKDISLVLEERV